MSLRNSVALIAAVSTTVLQKTAASNLRVNAPQLGWNSYNSYWCNPTEEIIKTNAQGLIDQGFLELGYDYATVDCGWPGETRDDQGRLVWDADRFPSGGQALGDFLHGLGLKFGLYSGAGKLQCASDTRLASLGHELVDAETFAEWGGDSLKYDNCWPGDNMYPLSSCDRVDFYYPEPDTSARFRAMASALDSAPRDIVYNICQWGVGENVGQWASQIGSSWRVSNDIGNDWPSIWRITNEVVPYYRYTTVGAYPDMDMLMVGVGGLTIDEEKFHFSMWAINKSPLIIGCSLIPGNVRQESIDILKNEEVLAINQDPLGKQARLIRRYSEKWYDIWAGELSENKLVVAIANWNSAQTISLDLADVGVASAGAVRDIWAASDLGELSGTISFSLNEHEIKLLVLSSITPAPGPTQIAYYGVDTAELSNGPSLVECGSDCLPVNKKVVNMGSGATVVFSNVDGGVDGGDTLFAIDYINYEVALESAWSGGANVRNMAISVNGGPATEWKFPISGGDWYETGTLNVVVGDLLPGAVNTVVFSNSGSGPWSPDLVGFAVFE